METTERSDILSAASRIYAGCLASGKVNADNQNVVMDYALRVAVKMAHHVERRDIFSDVGEVSFPW